MKREFGLSSALEDAIEKLLIDLNMWDRWPELARAVIDLSNHFHSGAGVTPWGESRFQAAYLAYFLPLNFARLRAVVKEASLQSLPITNRVIDIGSGPGTATLAWDESGAVERWTHWEVSSQAQKLHQQLLQTLGVDLDAHNWTTSAPELKGNTVVASYALNEMKDWPDKLLKAETLIIAEPSTQESARRLMAYRQTLKANGFFLWAPCTHQLECPLLVHSKTDWCHDRVFFSAPKWWSHLENHLPMRNQTLTFSYLLASKVAPTRQPNDARVIGDTLKEKGKWRQAVCRNDSREFLAWLTRHGEPEIIPHGSMIQLPDQPLLKGNEIRLS